MAVVRTVLPRKGIIQPQHGDNYEADLDANWLADEDGISSLTPRDETGGAEPVALVDDEAMVEKAIRRAGL